MGYTEFKKELARLLSINDPTMKGAEVTPETPIEGMDSLSLTELCVLAEEHLAVSLAIQEVKPLKTYEELQDLLSSKGYGP